MTLIIQCQEHYDKVMAFAREVGAEAELQEQLDRLGMWFGEDIECELYTDFAPHSFLWANYRTVNGERKMVIAGGLIYSGPGVPSNGSAPSFTVSLNSDAACGSKHQWSVHT
jgi:hypothetical protein